jgi:hypothetical protein
MYTITNGFQKEKRIYTTEVKFEDLKTLLEKVLRTHLSSSLTKTCCNYLLEFIKQNVRVKREYGWQRTCRHHSTPCHARYNNVLCCYQYVYNYIDVYIYSIYMQVTSYTSFLCSPFSFALVGDAETSRSRVIIFRKWGHSSYMYILTQHLCRRCTLLIKVCTVKPH